MPRTVQVDVDRSERVRKGGETKGFKRHAMHPPLDQAKRETLLERDEPCTTCDSIYPRPISPNARCAPTSPSLQGDSTAVAAFNAMRDLTGRRKDIYSTSLHNVHSTSDINHAQRV